MTISSYKIAPPLIAWVAQGYNMFTYKLDRRLSRMQTMKGGATACTHWQAMWSGVQPSLASLFTSHPASAQRYWTISRWPPLHWDRNSVSHVLVQLVTDWVTLYVTLAYNTCMHIISRAPHTHTYSIAGTNLGFVQVYSDYLVDINFDLNHGGGGGGGG